MINHAAAAHCARITAAHYRLAGIEPPHWLRQHLQSLTGSAHGTASPPPPAEWLHDELIDSDQAASILGYSARYVRRIATDLDGQQICGRWAFSKQTVLAYATARARHGEN